MYKGNEKKNVWRESKFAVGYLSVLNTPEVVALIVSGACRHSADYLSFYSLGYSHTAADGKFTVHSLTPYFYGACFGISIMGPIYDLFLSGAPYLIVCSMTLLVIALQLYDLISNSSHEQDHAINLSFYGAVTVSTELFI